METLQLLVAEYPHYAALILIVGKVIGAIAFLPGTPLTLLAGATFGVWYGTLISLVGNIVGATFAFLIARYVMRGYVAKHLLSKYKKLETYEEKFFKEGMKTVLLLRLIPLFPFNALNYLLGVTRVSTRDYMIGTSIGIIPGTFAFVYFGESLAMLSPINIALAVIAIAGLVLIGKKFKI
ncbi:MAG: hypothetical protein RI935_355 [Candidatus Parcubacteria bacterium]|jgi:uncharacterized membrane protein YdjX (TVP38/TMEM64 family)